MRKFPPDDKQIPKDPKKCKKKMYVFVFITGKKKKKEVLAECDQTPSRLQS